MIWRNPLENQEAHLRDENGPTEDGRASPPITRCYASGDVRLWKELLGAISGTSRRIQVASSLAPSSFSVMTCRRYSRSS